MTADELYEFEARVGPSSEWEPLYRAEKRRADAAEAKLAEVRALHVPVPPGDGPGSLGYAVCAACTDADTLDPYPCATVRTLDAQ